MKSFNNKFLERSQTVNASSIQYFDRSEIKAIFLRVPGV
jgi:hypothetical protein